MNDFSKTAMIVREDATTSERVLCAVIYEDTVSRDRALKLCDELVRKLWGDLEFEFSWWRFDYLKEDAIASMAAEFALQTDITLFAARSGNAFPAHVCRWIDEWSCRRQKGDGVLVALIGSMSGQGITPMHTYLHQVATRSAMDYLPQWSDAALPNRTMTFEAIDSRANQKTALLNDILQHPNLSPHWGINE